MDYNTGGYISNFHDDVIKWKHFPRYWPYVRGIHRSSVNSPHKGQLHGALMFSFVRACTNGWSNNRDAGDLRRHRGHHDATVMTCFQTHTHTHIHMMMMVMVMMMMMMVMMMMIMMKTTTTTASARQRLHSCNTDHSRTDCTVAIHIMCVKSTVCCQNAQIYIVVYQYIKVCLNVHIYVSLCLLSNRPLHSSPLYKSS